MTSQEARDIYPEYKRKKRFYTMDVPGKWHGKRKRRRYVLDLTKKVKLHSDSGAASPRLTPARPGAGAARQGNVTRLVNHACGAGANLVQLLFEASASLSKTWQDQVPPTPVPRASERRSAGPGPSAVHRVWDGAKHGTPGYRPGRRGTCGGGAS
jgi:hypothetical protein